MQGQRGDDFIVRGFEITGQKSEPENLGLREYSPAPFLQTSPLDWLKTVQNIQTNVNKVILQIFAL